MLLQFVKVDTVRFRLGKVGIISVDGKMGATITLDPLAMPDSMSLPRYYLEELKDLMSSLEVRSRPLSKQQEKYAIRFNVGKALLSRFFHVRLGSSV